VVLFKYVIIVVSLYLYIGIYIKIEQNDFIGLLKPQTRTVGLYFQTKKEKSTIKTLIESNNAF
jgi:hypothetical protein